LGKKQLKFSLRNYLSFFAHPAHGSGLRAWLGMLSGNRFSIHLAFLPKVILITFTVVLSSPFRWFERIRYNQRILSVKVKEPIFILGHPRSGTTFLHYLMSKDRHFAYCNTMQAMVPHLFLSGSGIFPKLLSKALPEKRPMDNLKMGASLPKEEEFAMSALGPESLISSYYFPGNYSENFKKYVIFSNSNPVHEKNWKKNFDFLLRKLLFRQEEKTLLLKSPGNTGRIKQILELYPDAKFVHIYRNPYDVYQSNVHLYRKLLPMLSFQHIKIEPVEEFVLESYELLMNKYLKEKSLIRPDRIAEVKYEDFVLNPLKGLEHIYRELQLKDFDQVEKIISDELKNYEDYQKNIFSLTKVDEQKVSERWRKFFEEFSYSIKT
jgi:hypothetical protein